MKVEAFEPKHVAWLENYGGQEYLLPLADDEGLRQLAMHGNHYSFFHEGELIACGGFIKMHELRAQAWALFRSGKPELFLPLHIVMKHLVVTQPFRRIEAFTDPSFKAATRWIKALGFRLETPYKPFFFPDGRGASEWVRFNEA